ncbi:MAG: sulfatase-like hydrolase/transferase [Nitrospira sp.]|nr:sulfatase-like hydrolase/transferase [Nitrospira sp.]
MSETVSDFLNNLFPLVISVYTKPNILFIVADDLGFSDIEPFGSKIIKTTELNKLAGEGMLFANFHVLPTCSPTRSALSETISEDRPEAETPHIDAAASPANCAPFRPTPLHQSRA